VRRERDNVIAAIPDTSPSMVSAINFRLLA
jgi:hypothetical protein